MDARNATASWSGYLHQGKVGIFLGLTEIAKLLKNNPNGVNYSNLQNWEIEYESAEDIDIKNNGKVVSRHQVKAYATAKYPNDYKDVLSVLEYEFKSGNCGETKIKTKGFRICEFNGITPGNIEVDKDNRYLHTITETAGFCLNKTDFNNQYPSSNFVPNPNNIKLYKYPDGNYFCEFLKDEGNRKVKDTSKDKIKEFCLDKIDEIAKIKNITVEKEKIYYTILDKLDAEIRLKHFKGKMWYPIIKFVEIEELININPIERDLIAPIREAFCNVCGDVINEQQYTDKQIENVNNIVEEIYSLSNEKFVKFLKDINPNETVIGDIETVDDIAKLIKIDSLKDIFYFCLVEVENEPYNLTKRGYEKDGGYLLTKINRRSNMISVVINEILTNPSTTRGIFEKRYLINGQIDGKYFKEYIYIDQNNQGSNSYSKNWKKLMDKDEAKFYSPEMEFISVDRAIEQLNNSIT